MSARSASGGPRPATPRARGSLLYGGIAVIGGLVLAESLFLPWYGLHVTVAEVEVGSSHSAWQAMSVMDALLLLVALVALMGGVDLARWAAPSPLLLAAGPAGLLLSLIGLIDLPDAGLSAAPGDTASVGREAGGFVALIASVGITFAGFAATQLPAPAARPPARSPSRPRPARPRTGEPRLPSTGRGR
jgi:hypothetical protein